MRKDIDFYARECYCKNMRQITSQITKLYDQHLKEAGVTCQQFSTLECVRAIEPVSVTELSRKMRLDRSSLSRNLKIMKTNRLIEDHAGSGRSRQIVLSEHGKTTLLEAEKQWAKAQAALESMFDSQQLDRFKEMLHILNDRLN